MSEIVMNEAKLTVEINNILMELVYRSHLSKTPTVDDLINDAKLKLLALLASADCPLKEKA